MATVGELREVVRLLRRATPTADRDGLGQPADQYIPYERFPVERAKITPVAGSEVEQAGQTVGIVVFMVEMRYREDVTTDTVLEWTSKTTPVRLNVKSVPADPTNRRMRITFLAVNEEEGV